MPMTTMTALRYDIQQEKEFNYKGLTTDEIIEHIVDFVTLLWQNHPFREGNTRTTAVFVIKYLRSIGFKVEAGKSVALVGRSGSGKSTIASLLTRFYDIEEGEILLDGVNIREYRLSELRKQYALVSQHVHLFNDSVANNIAYAAEEKYSRDEIKQAARIAHADDFVSKMPEGYDTVIGENGASLSGGQRQRIAIARALLRDSPVLLLDEATSALDTESERHIQAAIDELCKARTSLVIAHRLSTIEKADEILVIDEGHIVERGNHQTLMDMHGTYAQLRAIQFGNTATGNKG
jgi:subfamily B ATP-binding cassette protein MsbA